jgi:hypothetical protein
MHTCCREIWWHRQVNGENVNTHIRKGTHVLLAYGSARGRSKKKVKRKNVLCDLPQSHMYLHTKMELSDEIVHICFKRITIMMPTTSFFSTCIFLLAKHFGSADRIEPYQCISPLFSSPLSFSLPSVASLPLFFCYSCGVRSSAT